MWDYLKPGGWYFIEDIHEKFEPCEKLLEFINDLGDEGNEVSWFEYPNSLKDNFDPEVFAGSMHDSNLIAVRKKFLTTEEVE